MVLQCGVTYDPTKQSNIERKDGFDGRGSGVGRSEFNMKRREFFTGLAAILLPPLPPGFKSKHKRIESPKGREHRMSLSVMQKPTTSKAFAVTPAGFSINSIQYISGTAILQWSGGTG